MTLHQRAINTFNKNVNPDITQQGVIDELPTVTTTDNGKILKVVTGEWAAANASVAANQADSSATTVAGLKDDLNALLAKLKAAGLMTADATDE